MIPKACWGEGVKQIVIPKPGGEGFR